MLTNFELATLEHAMKDKDPVEAKECLLGIRNSMENHRNSSEYYGIGVHGIFARRWQRRRHSKILELIDKEIAELGKDIVHFITLSDPIRLGCSLYLILSASVSSAS